MTLLKPENLQPFGDGWTPPDGEAVKEVLSKAGLTGTQAARLTGTANVYASHVGRSPGSSERR